MVDDSKLIINGWEFGRTSAPALVPKLVTVLSNYIRDYLEPNTTVFFHTGRIFSGWNGPFMLQITVNKHMLYDISLTMYPKTNIIIETPSNHIAKRYKLNIPVKPRFLYGKQLPELLERYPGLPYPKVLFHVSYSDTSHDKLETTLESILTKPYYDKDDWHLTHHNIGILYQGK